MSKISVSIEDAPQREVFGPFTASAPPQTFTLKAHATMLLIYRNGLLYYEGGDYTVTSDTSTGPSSFTFLCKLQTGDVVQAVYW